MSIEIGQSNFEEQPVSSSTNEAETPRIYGEVVVDSEGNSIAGKPIPLEVELEG